ncbi:hypothetical protein RRG08_037515 [Elysia crispata]|uniref:Uncharacterized protein n=1 Tax=Elysia crispata TaxID=231223 RepID=A0AAE1A415_9GAST|nr:hypothetical protein RRG08_037515 [Elysia crispata]
MVSPRLTINIESSPWSPRDFSAKTDQNDINNNGLSRPRVTHCDPQRVMGGKEVQPTGDPGLSTTVISAPTSVTTQ